MNKPSPNSISPAKIRFVFFGTSEYSVITLNILKNAGLLPTLMVTTPDKPRGRGLALTPSPVKTWALEQNIPFVQPEKLAGTPESNDLIRKLQAENFDVFIVVSYGKIIPKSVIDIPRHGALNIHPSLLPLLRGPSPIETAILEDRRDTGVSIISIDEKMDHGPIVAEEKITVTPWPPRAEELGTKLVEAGSRLLVKTLPAWINGTIIAHEQDHDKATYTKKIEKTDGLIELSNDDTTEGDARDKETKDYKNFLKIQAYSTWPRVYFFHERKNGSQSQQGQKIRITITSAEYKNGALTILKVIPDGKKEMGYADFARNY